MLEVPAQLSDRWLALAREVRERVEAFLEPSAAPRALATEGDLPPTFADDLAGGGGQLRAAFPALARRMIAIERGSPSGPSGIEIRIACEGDHDGDFYGLLRPSGRHVRFDEKHELLVRGEEVAAHRVGIDLRAIVRQLSASRAAD
jgi:hypothetical protein